MIFQHHFLEMWISFFLNNVYREPHYVKTKTKNQSLSDWINGKVLEPYLCVALRLTHFLSSSVDTSTDLLYGEHWINTQKNWIKDWHRLYRLNDVKSSILYLHNGRINFMWFFLKQSLSGVRTFLFLIFVSVC